MKNKLFYIFLILGCSTTLGSLFIDYKLSGSAIDNLTPIISSVILLVFSISLILIGKEIKEKKGKIFLIISISLLIIYNAFNITTELNILNLPSQATIRNFTNVNISEALTWGEENNIEIEQLYVDSDTIPEYAIISQDIESGSLQKEISKITFTISNGPNYEKSVIVPNMLGWTLEDTLTYIENNYLINVSISFIFDSSTKDTVIEQEKFGSMQRNEELNLIFSLGEEGSLIPFTLEDLTGLTLFEAEVYLKRNGASYTIEKSFSEEVERDYVISQNIEKDTSFDQTTDTLTLTVSKGKEIIVPNLLTMNQEKIIAWVIDNKLKIDLSDDYDDEIEIGKPITVNYNENDIIEEETLISVKISKGPLKMEAFSSLTAFKEWATKYNVSYNESYEFSDTISSGQIISFSYNENDIIPNNATIEVEVSQGKPIKIPNFIGKSQYSIKNTCSSLGLKCSFYDSAYSTTADGYAIYQNKRAGSVVISGTYVSIGLSKGTAQTFTLVILQSDLSIGSYSGTIASLKSKFSTEYKDVSFKFVTKASDLYNGMAGYIHPDSPTKGGDSIKQGNTYTIYITQ